MTAFFTTGSAARELGVTPGRVRAMIAAGRLQATLAGRDWLIPPKALEAVRDRKARPPASYCSKVKVKSSLQDAIATKGMIARPFGRASPASWSCHGATSDTPAADSAPTDL